MSKSPVSIPLCVNVAQVGAQASKNLGGMGLSGFSVQATVEGTGSVSATVVIEVSNDGRGWLADSTATLSLSGSNVATDGFISSGLWQFARANITAITGTNARVTATVGA